MAAVSFRLLIRRGGGLESAPPTPVFFFEVPLVQNVPLRASRWDIPFQRSDLLAHDVVDLVPALVLRFEDPFDFVQDVFVALYISEALFLEDTNHFVCQIGLSPFRKLHRPQLLGESERKAFLFGQSFFDAENDLALIHTLRLAP